LRLPWRAGDGTGLVLGSSGAVAGRAQRKSCGFVKASVLEEHGYWMALTLREISPGVEICALNISSKDRGETVDAIDRAIDLDRVSPHISPASCCDRRCTDPSGVFSPRGARRTVEYALRALEARLGSPVPSADGSRESRSRREEEVDARASSTTSNAEIGHDPHRPEGLRRHGPVFFVAAPRRWRDIAVVAAPRIRTHGARNGRRWGTQPGLLVENPAGIGTSPSSRRNPVRYAG